MSTHRVGARVTLTRSIDDRRPYSTPCPGTVESVVRDATQPDHWRYFVRWDTGTSGWWGEARLISTDPAPAVPGTTQGEATT